MLEVIIARMKFYSKVRFIAVSATVPNLHDIGQWIGRGWSEGGIHHCQTKITYLVPATTLVFGEEFRPVKLERYCYGYPQGDKENDFQFDHRLNTLYFSSTFRIVIAKF